ncbi:MAG: hypothetical protein ACFWUC_04960 [Oscillospiraceae bacterium]|jgi:hypothetical protein
MRRFFRGVCPILNRATNILSVRKDLLCNFSRSDVLNLHPDFAQKQKSGFSFGYEETPGTVFRF